MPAERAATSDGVDLLVNETPSLRIDRRDSSPVDQAANLPRSAQEPPPTAESSSEDSSSDETAEGRADSRELILRARDIHRLRSANRTRSSLMAPLGTVSDSAAAPATPTAEQTASFESATKEAGPLEVHPSDDADIASEEGIERDLSPTVDVETAARIAALAARMEALGPVPPVPASEMGGHHRGGVANRQEADDRYDSIPRLDPLFELPFRERRAVGDLRAGFDDGSEPGVDAVAPDVDDRADSAPPMSQGRPQDEVWPGSAAADNRWKAARERRTAEVASEVDIDPPAEDTPPPASDLRRSWDDAGNESWRPLSSSARLFAPSLADLDEDGYDELVAAPFTATEPVFSEDDQADRQAPAMGEETDALAPASAAAFVSETESFWSPSEMTEALWWNVPRCCRSCREFRPADGGERGWCTSAWAFQHRRMVHADEMPCVGAIGSWWLPRDEFWLQELDSDLTGPTPLIDALLAERARAEEPEPAPIRRRGRW